MKEPAAGELTGVNNMLKKIKIMALAFFILSTISVFAQDRAPDFRNITFSQTGKEGTFNLYRVNYQGADADVSIMLEGNPGERERETLKIFANEIFSWKTLTVKSVKLIFKKEGIEINVIPDSLTFNETELSPYLPAGITFIHAAYTKYDFRVVKDNYFIRIRGQYYGPDLLLKAVDEAVADPVKYIAANDPEFMIKQISEIKVNDSNQDGKIDRLEKDLETLSAEYKNLSSAHKKLLSDFETLRYAYIAVTRKGIYGKKEPIPQNDIDSILEIKTRRSSATVDEVYEEARDKGMKISKGKVALILNTYFSSY